ncbi:MAG: tRNA-binding protein [Thiotrichales bacterium]|nr:tRNA-binding protein [Thiotrichales bacterium]MCY4286396.1 tRNA-binding protein [Thiotrichales bacterium]MCY4348601.1 tRNA-binding protein [Thiotrichales bacterium]
MSVETQAKGEISFEDFLKVRIVTGTIVEAVLNPKARVPAFVLEIDFGDLGRKRSSAQLTRNYTAESLVGKQIVAVANFPPKRVAGVKSEVLVLGAMSEDHGVVLLEPSFPVENGARIA